MSKIARSIERTGIPTLLKNVATNLLQRPSRWFFVEVASLWPTHLLLRIARKANGFILDAGSALLIASAIRANPRCLLLVFGMGNDSLLWSRLNRGGRTVFIEDDPEWFERITARHPRFEAYLVDYGTRRSQWEELIDKPDELEMTLPENVAGVTWDVVIVDGPRGWLDSHPGRMKSIFTAAQLVRRPGDVFVDDSDRPVEKTYSDRFLGAENVVAESGRLKQFRMEL